MDVECSTQQMCSCTHEKFAIYNLSIEQAIMDVNSLKQWYKSPATTVWVVASLLLTVAAQNNWGKHSRMHHRGKSACLFNDQHYFASPTAGD
jgi:hypothetical protein